MKNDGKKAVITGKNHPITAFLKINGHILALCASIVKLCAKK